MTSAGLNDPGAYYAADEQPSLAWEMTVCQSLARADSLCQRALRRPRRYGEALAEFLSDRIGLAPHWSVVEVGGGYGTLMAALLDRVPLGRVTMVDLSSFFLGEQRRALSGRDGVSFVHADALAFARGLGGEVDLVVSNENIGDLPTAIGLSRDDVLQAAEGADCAKPTVARVGDAVRRYGLDLSGAPETFAFNLGAVEYLEALAPAARAVFLSEHSAEAAVPPPFSEFVRLPPSDGYPRRVPLRGHDEYTIKFSHLEQVARRLGYEVLRLPLLEVLGLRDDREIRTMVGSPTTLSETAEVVHEFFHHVAEYEALLLTR